MGFTIRVELNGTPSAAVYENLHGQLATVGMYRTIKGDSGKWYQLPNATYHTVTSQDMETVRDIAVSLANLVWKGGCEVIVTGESGSAWYLKAAGPAPQPGLGGLAALFNASTR